MAVELSDADVAVRAYEHWKRRGRPQGDPEEDWFTARAELRRERALRAYDAQVAQYA